MTHQKQVVLVLEYPLTSEKTLATINRNKSGLQIRVVI